MAQRRIETFLAVARLKTLKAAAGKLHLAQSTVSKRLQLLEEEYGIVLFDRGKGGKEAALTPAGERFVDIAERLLDLTYEAKSLGDEETRLHVAIGAVTSMNAIIFPHLYSRLLAHEKHLHLAAITLHSAEMYDEVDARRCDVAYSLLERAHPGVAVRRCFSELMLGMRLTGDGGQGDGVIALDSLDPKEEIYFPWTPMYQIWHQEWCPAGSTRITVDDPHLLVGLLRHPGQWAIVPLSVARYFQRLGGCSVFRPTPEPPARVCYELTHKYPRSLTLNALALVRTHLYAVLAAEFGGEVNHVEGG